MKLSVRELRIVRAALLFALEGNDTAWAALSPSDMDIAENLFDALPNLSPAEDALEEEDDEYDAEDEYS